MTTSPKSELRASALQKRANLTGEARESAEVSICTKLVSAINRHATSPLAIAGYAAIRSELDILPALYMLAKLHTIALPVLKTGEREMHFSRWIPGETLQQGRYNIPEPTTKLPLIPNILIVPLLAFDRDFHRLGYGAGYYDTALESLRAQNPSFIAVGVAFAVQEIPSTAALSHDQMLDWIITEKEVILRP